MTDHPKFQTHNGYCHLKQDEIVLNYEANSLEPSSELEGKAWVELVIVSVMIFVLILFFTFTIVTKNYSNLLLYSFIAFSFLNWPMLRYLRLSNESRIKVAAVSEVKYRISKLGRKRGYFDVKFRNEKGRKRIRIIKMARFENHASEEIKKAKEIFNQLGVLKEG
jgi:hypothetical protein